MLDPFYSDDTLTLHHGPALDVLRELPAESVACIVTSPPYFAQRAYGDDPAEHGAEQTVGEFVDAMRAVMAECRRVLEPTGTLWLNLADTYSGRANARMSPRSNRTRGHQHNPGVTPPQRNTIADAPFKSLLMVPERVALGMVEDRWVLRNKITWHKPNATPESVNDRFTTKSELVYLFSKGPRYWFDLDPLREVGGSRPSAVSPAGATWNRESHPGGSNPGDHWTVDDDYEHAEHHWTIPTTPFPGAHFAVMAPEVARRCIVAGARPGGVVLDPFSGSGTTGMVAAKHGHPYIGVDLYEDNLRLSLETRLQMGALIP